MSAAWSALAVGFCALLPVAAIAAADETTSREHALIALWRSEAVAYEHGAGRIERDGARAAALYCKAARLGDAESQFRLGWMYANARGVERSDTLAAFFFHAAAEQGLEQAQRMLHRVGGPTTEVPACMRESAAAPSPAAAAPPSVTAAPPPRAAPEIEPPKAAARPIVELVHLLAPEFQVQPRLALAIIEAESNFNFVARSPKNAQGLMQLIPATAARFNVRNPYDPAQNIRGGLAYLRWLLAYFEGDVLLVAAAYNAGEATVERYRGVPPYLETRAYVRRILRAVGSASHPFDAAVTSPSVQLPQIRAAGRTR